MEEFTLQELSPEEGAALTKDLQDVLTKHNCEMGVKAAIQLLKRVPKEIKSPYHDGTNPDKTEETTKID